MPARFSVERYLALVDEGVLSEDDRVELLEGVVVAMSPRNPPHDTSVSMVCRALITAIAHRAAVRCQSTLILGQHSAPEPDVAVVEGRERDYRARHPTTALLIVEVADSSLAQDRLTKAVLYATAGIPEYWIINLRDQCIEVLRQPIREQRRYVERRIVRAGEQLEIAALPGVRVAVDDLLPDVD
jgi:Uma2 family endonuclease